MVRQAHHEDIWRREGLKVPRPTWAAEAPLAERRLGQTRAAAPPQPRVELRLRAGPDAPRTIPAHPDADRHAQPGLPLLKGGAAHPQLWRDRGAGRRDVPSRRPGAHPLRQWSRDDRESATQMGRRGGPTDPVHRARTAVGERSLRRLQRQAPPRVTTPGDLLRAGRGADRERSMAIHLHPCPTAFVAGLSAARACQLPRLGLAATLGRDHAPASQLARSKIPVRSRLDEFTPAGRRVGLQLKLSAPNMH